MMLKRFLLCAVVAAACTILCAAPAKRNVTLEQPDGTRIEALLYGDENMRILTDLQGHALIQGSDGFYCYASYDAQGEKLNSGVRVGARNASERVLAQSTAIPYGILAAKGQEKRQQLAQIRQGRTPILRTMGVGSETRSNLPATKTCIVIPAEYSDIPMTYTREDLDRVFNERGYSLNGATGSVADYFEDQLGGECSFSFDVFDIVKLRGKQAAYGANVNGSDKDPEGAVKEACMTAARLGLDFSKYDDDGDGEVDNVFVICSGKDEADGGGDNAIWAHQYYLYDGAAHIDLMLNGKRINTYTICAELAKRKTGQYHIATIGTLCHEYGHTLGLMDMYDVDGYSSGGYSPGLWSTGVMDTGCYLNDGNTPAHYSAIDYDTIGCGNPQTLTTGSYELEPISEGRKFYKIEGSVKNEYYLVECRAAVSWDKYMGGKGLAIYHIDRSSNKVNGLSAFIQWTLDAPNNDPSHMCAQMIAPTTSCNSASQAFWPYGKINTFTPETKPAFRYWNDESAGVVIANIERSGDNVKFVVEDAQSFLIPGISSVDVDAFQTGAVVTVKTDKETYDGSAIIEYQAKGEPHKATLTNLGNGTLAAKLDELAAGADYTASVYLNVGNTTGKPQDASFSTIEMNEDGDPYIYLKDDTRIPLVVIDANGVSDVRWYYNGGSVFTDKSGYFTPTKSGRLKASIRYEDGDREIIIKDIIVK